MGFALSSWTLNRIAEARENYLARLVARLPSEDDTAEAEVFFGRPSDFAFALGRFATLPVTNTVNLWPVDRGDDDKEEDKPEPVFDYTEIGRTVKQRRVENPDDADQYVMVEDATSITFSGQDGKTIRLNFTSS